MGNIAKFTIEWGNIALNFYIQNCIYKAIYYYKGKIFQILIKLIGITVFYILFTEISARKKSYPEVINWREPLADVVSSIQTSFSEVINDNAPIRYSTGSELRQTVIQSKLSNLMVINQSYGNYVIPWTLI